MKSSDSRRNKSGAAKLFCACDSRSREPSLVPGDFPEDIVIGRIVLVFMSKCVADMRESIQIGLILPPNQQSILFKASRCIVWVGDISSRPDTSTSTQWLDKLQRSVDLVVIFDGPRFAESPSVV